MYDWLQILAQAKAAARHARARLKGFGPSMGYLRARRDGSAQLAILVGNNMGKKKGVAPLGAVVGRLNDGTAHLQVSVYITYNFVYIDSVYNSG